MVYICGKRFTYIRNGFTMLEMASEFDNGLKCVEITYICGKWLQYLRNGRNMLEMTCICGKWLKYVGNGLNI